MAGPVETFSGQGPVLILSECRGPLAIYFHLLKHIQPPGW